MSARLTRDNVAKVADLARLDLTDAVRRAMLLMDVTRP